MRRRSVLALAVAAFAGCGTRAGDGGGSVSPASTTGTPAQTTGTPAQTTGTPDLPASCPTSPDVGGLPDRPGAFAADPVTSFVRAYERRIARARNPDVAGFERFDHVDTLRVEGGFRVHFYVVPRTATVTPATSTTRTTGESTSTSTPTTGEGYNVGYVVTRRRIVRDVRPDSRSYQYAPWDGFDPREGGELVQCGSTA
jgi:hypothetical protein